MARTMIPVEVSSGEGVVLPLVPGDVQNGHGVDISTGRVLLQAYNTDALPHDIVFIMTTTIDGVEFQDIVRTVAPMTSMLFGPLEPVYYANQDGIAEFTVDSSTWVFASVRV